MFSIDQNRRHCPSSSWQKWPDVVYRRWGGPAQNRNRSQKSRLEALDFFFPHLLNEYFLLASHEMRAFRSSYFHLDRFFFFSFPNFQPKHHHSRRATNSTASQWVGTGFFFSVKLVQPKTGVVFHVPVPLESHPSTPLFTSLFIHILARPTNNLHNYNSWCYCLKIYTGFFSHTRWICF